MRRNSRPRSSGCRHASSGTQSDGFVCRRRCWNSLVSTRMSYLSGAAIVLKFATRAVGGTIASSVLRPCPTRWLESKRVVRRCSFAGPTAPRRRRNDSPPAMTGVRWDSIPGTGSLSQAATRRGMDARRIPHPCQLTPPEPRTDRGRTIQARVARIATQMHCHGIARTRARRIASTHDESPGDS